MIAERTSQVRTIEFHSQQTLNKHRRLKREQKVDSAASKANQLLKKLEEEIQTP